METLVKDLHDILDLTIVQVAKGLLTNKNSVVRQVLRSVDGYESFVNAYSVLRLVFSTFNTGKSTLPNTLALQEFGLLLREMNQQFDECEEKNKEKDDIIDVYKSCYLAFGQAQKLKSKLDALEEIVFVEFVECLVYMGCDEVKPGALDERVVVEKAYKQMLGKVSDFAEQFMESKGSEEGDEEKGKDSE